MVAFVLSVTSISVDAVFIEDLFIWFISKVHTSSPYFLTYLFYKTWVQFIISFSCERSSRFVLVFRSEYTGGSESAENGDFQFTVDEVREAWRQLWRSRIDDRVRAEGIANRNFSLLFVDRGTVIIATRDFKPLDLKEILRRHKFQDVERLVPPHPSVGGWTKFARTVLKRQKRARKWKDPVRRRNQKKNLPPKKGGRGWLHYRMK